MMIYMNLPVKLCFNGLSTLSVVSDLLYTDDLLCKRHKILFALAYRPECVDASGRPHSQCCCSPLRGCACRAAVAHRHLFLTPCLRGAQPGSLLSLRSYVCYAA